MSVALFVNNLPQSYIFKTPLLVLLGSPWVLREFLACELDVPFDVHVGSRKVTCLQLREPALMAFRPRSVPR